MPDADIPVWATSWGRFRLALACLAARPAAFGGIHLRARVGPARDAAAKLIEATFQTVTPLHPSMTDDALFGGVDVIASMAAANPVHRPGLIARDGVFLLKMADRCTPAFAAKLTAAMDGGKPLVAIDEGAEGDDTLPTALIDRLAMSIDLSDVPLADLDLSAVPTPLVDQPASVGQYTAPITKLALGMGITGLRPPMAVLQCAAVVGSLFGHRTVTDADIAAATALILAPRALQWPEAEPEEAQQGPEESQTDPANDQAQPALQDVPQEVILEAVRANLPPDLLRQMARRKNRQAIGQGSGAVRVGNRRGRPLPARRGRIGQGRIDLVATLRTAAPWQRVRRGATPKDGPKVLIRPSDVHLKRTQNRSDRLLVFAVDASGSAAMARLAEVKGAIELLLADAYSRRDHVCLVAFRGTKAELVLPANRSLARTKKGLAGLPGGGGTPLAAGLEMAISQSLSAKRKGMTPTIVLLTDGRSNITLQGDADRKTAGREAQEMAQLARLQHIQSLVIDTGKRPDANLRTLAQSLDATYVPLPRADAQRLSQTVGSAIES